jgi:hypothetical protein
VESCPEECVGTAGSGERSDKAEILRAGDDSSNIRMATGDEKQTKFGGAALRHGPRNPEICALTPSRGAIGTIG